MAPRMHQVVVSLFRSLSELRRGSTHTFRFGAQKILVLQIRVWRPIQSGAIQRFHGHLLGLRSRPSHLSR